MNKWQKLVQQQFLNNEEAVIGQLEDIYGKAQEDIEKKLNKLTFDIDGLKAEFYELDPDDPERARIKSIIQSKIYQKGYQEQLKKQVDGILGQMQASQFTTISGYLDECYNDGFIGTIFDQHGQGVPITTPINQAAMVRAVQLDSKISVGLYTKLGADIKDLKKRITAEVSRSISTGKSFKETAKLLENQTRIGYNNAIRIARTEGHRIQTTATKDCMIAAKERGADILKQWDATLDGGTRESHVAVDGQIRELNEPFSNGLDRPGDPAGAAAEVINCRCALLQRARWAVEGEDKSFTKFNNFTKQVESFDSPEKYSDFKKAFFSKENKEYMNYVEDMQDKYGTKDFKKVLASMSDREYKHYSKLLADNPIYNKNAKAAEETPVDTKLQNILNDIEKDARSLKHEEGTFLAQDGSIIAQLGGSSHQVNVPDELVPYLQNAVFTHNHPNGGTFSRDDISSFVKVGLFEVRASTPQGTFCSLKQGAKSNGQRLLYAFQEEKVGDRRRAQQKIQAMLDSGELKEFTDFNLIVRVQEQDIDEWLTANADKYGFIYTKGEL